MYGLCEDFLSIVLLVISIIAPIQSRKSGKHVSGFPGVAFVFCILAGVLSPCKWLVLLCLSDISVTALPFFLLREYIRNKKDK